MPARPDAAAGGPAPPTAVTIDCRVPLPGGGSLRAAIARPPGEGPHPALLVLHETFGLNDDIRRITATLADRGYVALAPDLFSHGNRLACLTRVLVDAAFAADHGTLADLDAALEHLRDQPDADGERVGVIGFCMGGGFALAVAARGGVRVAAANYGPVPKDRGALAGACPIVASYGGADRVYGSHADRLEAHLRALGIDHDVKRYDGVGHSFLSFDNLPAWSRRLPSPLAPGYDPEAAADAWDRIHRFFERHLAAAPS